MSESITRRDFQAAWLAIGGGLAGGAGALAQDGRRPPDEPPEPRVMEELRSLLPGLGPEDVRWLAAGYGNTAVNVARDHGRQGAEVLLALGPQGLAVLREQPDTFRQVASRLGGKTAAVFLASLPRNFEGLAGLGGLPRLLDRLEAMPAEARALGERHPQMLPFLAVAPDESYTALRRHPDLCLLCFPALDLGGGPGGLTRVARLIADYGERARPWVRARGLDGLLLLGPFPEFLDRVPPVELPVFLAILSNNQDDLAPLTARREAGRVWDALVELARWDSDLPEGAGGTGRPARGDLIRLACTDPHAVKFFLDRGVDGRRVIAATWPEAAQAGVALPGLLLDGYEGGARHPRLSENARQALVGVPGRERETFQMLLLMAQWGGVDPRLTHPRSERFRQLLAELGYRVVAYMAEAERDGGAVDDRYARLEERGKDELDAWECPPSFWVQQLPFYDTVHLAWLLTRGYTPTQGELIFAGIDVAFTAWDVATLGGGKAATAAARNGIRTADRALARRALEEVAERMAPRAVGGGAGSWGRRGLAGLAGQLANAPAVVRELSRRSLHSDVGVAVAQATRSAARLDIKLMTVAVGKYGAREWARNTAVGGTAQAVVRQVARIDNPLFADKAREALLYLNRFIEKPSITPGGRVRTGG